MDPRHASDDESGKHPYTPQGGEDEASADDGTGSASVSPDQQPINGSTKSSADDVDEDDPHKVERLTKVGRDLDPDEGSD